MEDKETLVWKFVRVTIRLVCLMWTVVAANSATSNFALRTGLNAFFRTSANSASLTPAKTITLEAWIKPNGPGVIFNEVDAFDITRWDQSLAELTAQGDVIVGMPGISGAVSVGKVNFGEWAHIVVRYNSTNGVLNGFVNGQKGPGFLAGNRSFPPATSYLAFGRTSRTNLGTGGWLSADFDEVRVWNVARTDADIAATWSSKITASTAGLVQNFHLDDGSGTNETPITDSAGVANGLNVGATWVPSGIQFAGAPVFAGIGSTNVSQSSVQLNAMVNPNGLATDYYFQYGASGTYGSSTSTNSLPAQYNAVAVTANIANLSAGSYNYRLVASNSFGLVTSDNFTFVLTNTSGFAANFPAQASYIRGNLSTRPFFTNAALTAEFWFEAQPGVLLNEVDAFDVSKWDYSVLEISPSGRLLAGLPGLTNLYVAQLQFGEWYHVALRYDPSIARMDVFLNGVLTASSSGIRQVPWDSGRTVYFALGRGGPTNLGLGAFYHGRIDEVRIWRVALPDATIAENIGLILSGSDPNLFADWSFESVFNGFSPDKSPTGNPAMFIGGADLAISKAVLTVDQRPSASTGLIQDSVADGAVLNGTVVSGSTNTIAFFIWGTGALTNFTRPIDLGQGTNAIQTTLNGLIAGTNYSIALVVSNEFGVGRGATVSFVKLGWAGYALSLSTNSYLRTVNDQHAFFSNETITVSLWINPTKPGVVMAETDRVSPSQFDSSIIEVLNSGSVVAGFPGVPTIVLGSINFGHWNNIVVRYDKTSQLMDGFVNGAKSAAASVGDRVAGWEIGRQVTYTFGKATADSIGTGEFLGGVWDEIELWATARTDAEILSNYNKKLLGSEPGLVAYYRFDEQTTTVPDISRHNNTAVVQGASSFVVSQAPITVSFTPIGVTANGTVTAQFIGIPGREMQIESTSDFQTWVTGPTAIANSIGIATFTVSQNGSMRYYRSKQL